MLGVIGIIIAWVGVVFGINTFTTSVVGMVTINYLKRSQEPVAIPLQYECQSSLPLLLSMPCSHSWLVDVLVIVQLAVLQARAPFHRTVVAI